MDPIPLSVEPLAKPVHITSRNEPQETIVVPLSKHGEIELRDAAKKIFPDDKISSISGAVTQEKVTETVNIVISHDDQRDLGFNETEIANLVRQDVEERTLDHTSLYITTQAKREVAIYTRQLILDELGRGEYEKISSADTAVLESMLADLDARVADLDDLSNNTLDINPDPLLDLQAIQRQKQAVMHQAHTIAGISEATERVSPEMTRTAKFHTGVLQANMSRGQGFLNERSAGVYTRENAGTMAHLLGLNIAREYGLPNRTNTSKREVEVFANGMGALGSVLESIEDQKPELIISEGVYFELPSIAERHGSIKKQTPINDELYFGIAAKLKNESVQPLVIFGQPFGSGMEEKVFDLDRTLKIIKDSEGKRPIVLVIDSTMHGASLQRWKDVEEITSSGKDFTLIEVQSLVKHGQIGMDTVPGGVALAYGTHPELVRASTASRGTMMQEHQAAVLFPFSAELQLARIQRAGRNAKYLAQELKTKLANNPIYNGVHLASESDPEVSNQYKTKPPILFIRLNPLIPPTKVDILLDNLTGLDRTFPESGKGTSYGFDGTRFEIIPIGEGGSQTLRIAAGQESSIPLMAMARHIEYQLNHPRFIRDVSYGLKEEIRMVSEPFGYDKENFKYRLYYDPSLNVNDSGDMYIAGLGNNEVESYLHDQCRGHEISEGLKSNPELKQTLEITDESLDNMAKKLDSPQEIRDWMTQYVITKPEFLNEFRKRLTVFGKAPSMEKAYQIAKAINSHKGVKIVLAPIAKIANQVLKEMQPGLEKYFTAKLPFSF